MNPLLKEFLLKEASFNKMAIEHKIEGGAAKVRRLIANDLFDLARLNRMEILSLAKKTFKPNRCIYSSNKQKSLEKIIQYYFVKNLSIKETTKLINRSYGGTLGLIHIIIRRLAIYDPRFRGENLTRSKFLWDSLTPETKIYKLKEIGYEIL